MPKYCVGKRAVRKRRFNSEKEVNEFLQKHPQFNSQSSYKCEKCGFLHLTSYDQETTESIQKLREIKKEVVKMAKLNYTKIQSVGSGRYDLMMGAKVKELIDFYKIESPFVFIDELQKWIDNQPKKNAFHFWNAYRLNLKDRVVEIWRHFADLHKDPILVYEIKEEVSNV